MNFPMRSRVRLLAAALAGGALPALHFGAARAAPDDAGSASRFPQKPVTLVVPNAPGGAVDILARLLERHLKDRWGQPVIVVYKPGGGTVLGTDFVAKAPADGLTLGLVVTSHVINPSLRSHMPFDTAKDLSGITMLATSPIAISARPGLPVSNLAELIAYARSNPGKLSYASPGSGSSMHLAGELLKTAAGIDMLHTPYKGSGPAYQDIFGERVDLIIDPLFSSLPHIQSRRMKALAVLGKERASIAPNIPTAAETLPSLVVDSIFGMVVSSRTPPVVVQKINEDVNAVLRLPELRSRMAEVALTPKGGSTGDFDEYIRKEIVRWAAVVKASGATAD